MTLQRPDSRLTDWEGPVFPALMPRLLSVLQAMPESRRSKSSLIALLQRVPGLEGVVELTATDGYTWPTIALVAVQGGVVAVALPAPALDRSPAAYTRGGHINEETANAIVARVIRALRPSPGARPILTGP